MLNTLNVGQPPQQKWHIPIGLPPTCTTRQQSHCTQSQDEQDEILGGLSKQFPPRLPTLHEFASANRANMGQHGQCMAMHVMTSTAHQETAIAYYHVRNQDYHGNLSKISGLKIQESACFISCFIMDLATMGHTPLLVSNLAVHPRHSRFAPLGTSFKKGNALQEGPKWPTRFPAASSLRHSSHPSPGPAETSASEDRMKMLLNGTHMTQLSVESLLNLTKQPI